MSKIGKLFKKVFKKDKGSDDPEEFYEEIDEEIEEYDLENENSDQTVILNQEEISEELIPHETKAEAAQVPADTELQFPDLPPEHTGPSTTEKVEFDQLQEEEQEQIKDEGDEFSDLTLNEEEEELDLSDHSESEAGQELIMMKEHGTETDREEEVLVDQETAQYSEEEEELTLEDNATEDFFEEDSPEYDLSESKLTLKEKAEQLKTRALDKFRKFNKKDLNQAFNSNEILNKSQFSSSLKEKILNINWTEIPQSFFNKNLQNNYHKQFKTAGTILTVVTLASLIGSLFNLSKDYSALTKRNLISLGDQNTLSNDDLNNLKAAQVFKTDKIIAKEGSEKVEVDKNIVCKTATRKSSANVKLINTVVLQDSVKSIASVQVRSSSKLQNIREGENLLGQVKIDKIERLRLIVKNLKTGVCESIESSKLEKSIPRGKAISVLSPKASKTYKKQLKKIDGIENDGNNFNIKKDFLKDKLSDISSILTQARGIQINNPDGTISFKVVDIEPGGVFAYLGVQDNDIITHINGEPITELNQVMSLFGKIGNIPNLKLTMKRAGEPITQNYNIK